MLKARTLVAIVLVYALAGTTQTAQRKHTITFTFDYDFGVTPVCSPKVTKTCVQSFNLYDISGGIWRPVKLGSVSAPPDAKGLVKDISATTQSLSFESGRHLLAIAAQMRDGSETNLDKCTVWVQVP